MNNSEALLVVERGPVPAMQFNLTAEQTSIGRNAGNQLVLADPEVSRRHARVIRRADGYAIEDTGSTNGTFVNGQRISHMTLLQDGDTIDLGDTVRLRFLAPFAAAIPSAPADEPKAVGADPSNRVDPNPPAYQPPPPIQPQPANWEIDSAAEFQLPPVPVTAGQKRGRGWLLGCGIPVALLLVCAGTFLILDAYDQGRLLYCGALSPFFEVILGPFGFSPICP